MTRKPRKPVHHVEMTEGKREIIRGLLEEYDIESAQDIQDALKDLNLRSKKTSEGYFGYRPEDHIDIRKGNDHKADI